MSQSTRARTSADRDPWFARSITQLQAGNGGGGSSAPGPPGPTGPAGPPGADGAPGPAGAAGPQGAQGKPGATGAASTIPGPPGPPGPQGQGITIKGTVATHANLPTTGNTVGDMWITADTGHGWTWQANATWLDAGPIQGPPGSTGATGPPGPTGPIGPSGAQGLQGNPGATGPAGATGATGPAGATGSAGPAGPQGAQGVQGAQGPVGPQGPQGIAGTPGGPPGPAGPAGAQGINAYTLNTAGFTVPVIGSSTVVSVADTSWIVVGQYLYVDTAGGSPGQPGVLKVIAKTPTSITLQNISTSVATGPPGPPGPSGILKAVWNEIPVGAINGANLIYSTANPYSAGLLGVYLNGLRQRPTADYTETGTQSFQFINAPIAGDSLSIDYIQP